jgi:tRNA/rRNA methyltransferase
MLSAAARSRLTVILVGARNPQNIDFAAPFEAAQLEAKSAVAAESVMQNARRFDSLAAAIADCHLIVATTAIGQRELNQTVLPLQLAAPIILERLGAPHLGPEPAKDEMWEEPPAPPRVALLFGSEKTGLTNDQLSHASLLTTIPLFAPELGRHLSMNLGQAVAVCLYELTRAGFEGARELPVLHEAAATAQDRELLTQLLLDVMHATGYTRRYPHNADVAVVRRLVQQLGAPHLEARTWMGILRQILSRDKK